MPFSDPGGVRFSSLADVDAFIVTATSRPRVASAVTDMHIVLGDPIPPRMLRQCLSIAPHLEDLILFLPRDSPEDILDDFHIPRLQLFKTNLPHRSLLRFISAHDTLTDLCLGACWRDGGEASCPLSALDLAGVGNVECPLSCIRAVAHPALGRLTGEIHPRSSSNGPTILRSIPVPLVSLYAMTLDFYANDYDILQSIVRIAPRLQKLKLLERPRAYRRQSHARRAWNDAASWSVTLLQLQWLEELAIRTASSITRSSQNMDSEGRTLMKWVSRSSRTAKRGVRVIEHPTLSSLRLWYRARDAAGGILSYWSKSSGVWQNILRAAPPPPDTFF